MNATDIQTRSVPEISQRLRQAVQGNISRDVVAAMLRVADKAAPRSWDDIFAMHAGEVDFFEDLLEQIYSFGKKSLVAFKANATVKSQLLSLEVRGDSILDVLDRASREHRLFRAGQSSDGRFLYFSFSCTRPANETHVLNESDLSQQAKQRVWKPDSIIKVISKIEVKCIDSILYDSREDMLFAVIDDIKYSYEDSTLSLANTLINKLQDHCPAFSELTIVDFFPAIDGIYKTKSEGLIHRLAFECETGVDRNEELKGGQIDLRVEGYHERGKTGLGASIRPFKLGVTWVVDPNRHPGLKQQVGLNILGTKQNLMKQSQVFVAEIGTATMYVELCFAISRLIRYV